MDKTLGTIVTGLLIPILPVIAACLVALIQKKTKEIVQNSANNEVKKYIGIAEDAACTAVVATNQTFVDALKKSNTFDQASMEEAFNMAKQKALSIMGIETQEALRTAYADFDAWLDSKIEFYVGSGKRRMLTSGTALLQPISPATITHEVVQPDADQAVAPATAP